MVPYFPSFVLERPSNTKIGQPYLNVDGFGIAWYTTSQSEFDPSVRGPRPAMYKTTVAHPWVLVSL